MNQRNLNRLRLKLASLAVLSLLFTQIASAQYFTDYGQGELVAGFRKTGAFKDSYELVVYLGNITNFIAVPVGTTIPITNYSQTQITNMCVQVVGGVTNQDNPVLANLQWSVFGGFPQIGLGSPWVTSVGTFQNATLWQTLPRTVFSTPSTPPNRLSKGFSQDIRAFMLGIETGANQIGPHLGATNQFNNVLLCTEPEVGYTGQDYSSIIDESASGVGNFNNDEAYDIENITPSPFSSAQRSDLYEFTVSGLADPFNGTSTNAAYLGYFTLNTDGTMTFTRDTNSVVSNPQPVNPVLSISSSESFSGGGSGVQVTSIISFSTTNAATYTLYYTNSTGLKTPITNWPSISTTITGDNFVHAFTNISTDPNRFYSVGAQ